MKYDKRLADQSAVVVASSLVEKIASPGTRIIERGLGLLST